MQHKKNSVASAVDELNAKLWKACDTFRSTIDSALYKDYILAFLFLKYISDIYESKVQEYTSIYKGDRERIKRRLKREPFVLNNKCVFNYIVKNRNKDNIGEIINGVFHEVEELNKSKLNHVFRNVDFNSETNLGKPRIKNDLLRHLINDFRDISLKSFLGHSDIIGRSYLYLIQNFAESAGKKGGEFFTPPKVSELLAKLIEPKEGDKIYDPACGTGSLLIKARREIKGRNFALYGQESNGGTWALAKMNMFLHGITGSYIEWGDTIRSPHFLDKKAVMQFNKVIANPPFSKKKWGYESAQNDIYNRFHRGLPPPAKGDFAFISHVVESLGSKGRAGVVVPHGVLFRGGAEGRIREKLIEEGLLYAVIGLPANLFFGVGIPVALLIFNKDRRRGKKDVLFISGSRNFEKGKKQNKLRDKDIQKILRAYKKRKTLKRYAYLAGLKEIRDNEYNLNIPRYVETFEEEEAVDIRQVKKEIKGLENQLNQVRQKMNHHLKGLGV